MNEETIYCITEPDDLSVETVVSETYALTLSADVTIVTSEPILYVVIR